MNADIAFRVDLEDVKVFAKTFLVRSPLVRRYLWLIPLFFAIGTVLMALFFYRSDPGLGFCCWRYRYLSWA